MGRIPEAAAFIAERFEGMKRKDGTPKASHSFGTMVNLISYGITDEESLLTALLHDTIEDTETTILEIEKRFGSRVASYVGYLTDNRAIQNKDERIQLLCEQLKDAPLQVRNVKLADCLHNITHKAKKNAERQRASIRRYDIKLAAVTEQGDEDLNQELLAATRKALEEWKDSLR